MTKKLLAAIAVALVLPGAAKAQRVPVQPRAPQEMRDVTPALAAYTDEVLFGNVWQRPGLSPQDRSIATVSALVAGGRTAPLVNHLNIAMENGVKPSELSGIITHLAFYSGWPNAVAAVGVAKDVFAKRGVPQADLLPASRDALVAPPNDAARAARVERQIGPVAPALADLTNAVLFGDLWRLPDLAPRDRSLVTISALIAGGDAEQLPFHIDRGLNNGLTREQLAEAITHLAFYAGWPKAMSTVPIANKVLMDRGETQVSGSAGSAEPLRITRGGASPSTGPAQNFTGSVKVDTPFKSTGPARVGGATVTFAPGARTAWHTHPLGQTLFITSGVGWVQREGGPGEEVRPGDVVWIPAGARHWHGAAPTSSMTHFAVAEALDGKAVEWMEQVTDQEYRRGPRAGGNQ